MAQAKHNSQTIAWFWDLKQRGMLDLEPPYQRRSVWNQTYRDYFVDTLLLEYPAPAIFLFEQISPTGATKYFVVDGKQRLLTVFGFVQGDFPIGEKAQTTALRGKYFAQLDDGTKARFWGYQFSVEYLPTNDEGVINNIFDRINRNVAKLTAQELRHAQFDGLFITAAEALAAWMSTVLPPQFPRITETSRKQMKDVEFVASLMLLLDEERPRSYSVAEMDAAFGERDENWDGQRRVEDLFRETVTFIGLVLKETPDVLPNSRLRNQADFYSFFGAVAALAKSGKLPVVNEAATRLLGFLHTVENENERAKAKWASDYYNAARSASNDAGPRAFRIQTMQSVLSGETPKAMTDVRTA